jgi:hypothetical protein
MSAVSDDPLPEKDVTGASIWELYLERLKGFEYARSHLNKRVLTPQQIRTVEAFLYEGARFAARRREIEAAKQRERECVAALRKLRGFARESINAFVRKSKQRVSGFERLESALLRYAEGDGTLTRKRHTESVESVMRQRGAGSLGIASRTDTLKIALSEIKRHANKPKPANWDRLLFELRRYFYIAREPHVDPRLLKSAHWRTAPAVFDLTNLRSFLQIACDWPPTPALEFASVICFPPKDPAEFFDSDVPHARARLVLRRSE